MDNLRAKLDKLKDWRFDYVMERSRVRTDAQGYKNAGVCKTTFYNLSEEERNYLNSLAQELKRATSYRAQLILEDAVEEAAIVKTGGLKSRNEHIRQAASSEILDRQIGKPTQHEQVEQSGAVRVEVEYVNTPSKAADVSQRPGED